MRPGNCFRDTLDTVNAVAALGHIAEGKLGACKGFNAEYCHGVDLAKDSESAFRTAEEASP